MKAIFIASVLLVSTALPSVACGNGNFIVSPDGQCIDLSNMQPVRPSQRVTPRPIPQQTEYVPRLDEQPRTPKDPEVEKEKKRILDHYRDPRNLIVPTPDDLEYL